jgi:CRISPR-associated exonuclease Cas4
MYSITPSHIIQYLYCPRFTYFEHVLRIPQFEENLLKVKKGREVHVEKATQNREYLRRRIGVIEKQSEVYLTNHLLRGEVDEVLTLKDGSMAPLDYKFAAWEGRLYETYQTQLLCYAWLIEDVFKKPVQKGYIVYTRSKNYLLEVTVKQEDIGRIKQAAGHILTILDTCVLPRSTRVIKRCVHCTYRNICPK